MEWFNKLITTFEVAKDASTLQSDIIFFVWTILFGFFISWIIIYYNRRIVGVFVRSILLSEANNPETAKTLDELDQKENVSAVEKYAKSTALQGIVHSDAETADEQKHLLIVDDKTRFYIPEDQTRRAQRMYDGVGNSGWMILAGVAGMLIIGIAISAIVLM